jgi:hypothetical protein
MSSPVREPVGPLSYAPRWVRSPGGIRAGERVENAPAWDVPPPRVAAPVPEVAPALEAPWTHKTRKKSRAVFEGDVAVMELRARLALAPDQIPEPLPSGGPNFGVVARLAGVMVVTTMGVLGFLWITAPRAAAPEIAGLSDGFGGSQAAGRSGARLGSPAGGPFALASYQKPEPLERPATIEARKSDRETPVPAGFASLFTTAGYTHDLSTDPGVVPAASVRRIAPVAPTPRAALPAAETRVAPSVASPPAAASTVEVPDREEIAALLARGRAYIADGDVAAARLVLRRAVEYGDPQAALALGGTYDPTVLKRLGVVSYLADPTQARDWYRKAAELGSADAPQRLEQLAQVDR